MSIAMAGMTQLECARHYVHDLGINVLPARGKRPVLEEWSPYRERAVTDAELQQWFPDDQQVNLLLVMGAASGNLVARDFDNEASYHAWAAAYPDLANTLPTVVTSRGTHVYGRTADVPTSRTLDDGEIKGEGSLCCAPNSIHESWVPYTWLIPPTEIPLIDLGIWEDRQPLQHRSTDNTEAQGICVSVLHLPTVRLAIRRCLPPGVGHRHNRLFRLARELKAIPEASGSTADDLLPVVQEWHSLALPYIGTRDFMTSFMEFTGAWKRVKFSIDANPVEDAWHVAKSMPIPPELARFGETNEQRAGLANLCRVLQQQQGEKPFFLDARTAGRLIGVEHTVAWRWLRGFCDIGLMKLVASGSQVKRKSNEYRYLGAAP